MNDLHRQGPVLAAHPTSRGFGWVVFEAPRTPVAWGIASERPNGPSRSLARFERLLARYAPTAFVQEDFDPSSASRSERIQHLCRSMHQRATASGMRTHIYPKRLIHSFFGNDARPTRYEIAKAVAAQIDDLSHRLPRKRRPGDAEDARQSLFDAAALAIVHLAKHAEPAPRAHSGAPE